MAGKALCARPAFASGVLERRAEGGSGTLLEFENNAAVAYARAGQIPREVSDDPAIRSYPMGVCRARILRLAQNRKSDIIETEVHGDLQVIFILQLREGQI